MLNVIVIASIAAVAVAISQTTTQFSASTVAIVNNRSRRWNSDDIEFFDSNFEEKFAFTNETVTHAEKDIYYRDVYVFVEQVKEMTIMIESKIVKKNLSSCLRESILIWHIAKLFEISKRILFYEKNVNEWIQTFIVRFKTQVITATVNLLRERYTLTNAKKNRESREYAQKVIRWIKFAELTSSFNQLNIVYNEIDAEFRRDLKKSFKETSIDEYLQFLNDCKDIWWALTKRNQKYSDNFTTFSHATSKQFQFNADFKFYDIRSEFFNQQKFNNWNSQKYQIAHSSSQFNNWRSYRDFNIYQNNQNQYQNFQKQSNRFQQKVYQSQSVSQQTSRTQSFNDARNTSKIILSSSENSQIKSSQNQWQNRQFQKFEINYQNKFQRAHFDDYDSQCDENWVSKSEQNSSAFYDEDEYYEDRSYDEFLKTSAKSENAQDTESDQKFSVAHFEEILSEKLTQMKKSSQLTLKCRQCELKFYSNNKLHKHLRSNQHASHRKTANIIEQKKIFVNISIVTSTRKQKDHKNFVFREHQYARVKRTFESNDESYELCADSETFMFLIDRKFLERIVSDSYIMKTNFNLNVRSIEFKTHDTSSYCALELYFREYVNEQTKLAHIHDEFHLVDDLQINVLIDMNIMSSEKRILNFKIKTMIFSICENIEIFISIIRTNQFVNCSLLIANKVIVSSYTNMTIFVKIREKSLSKRNYIFNSKRKILRSFENDFFNHILTNNSMKVLMKNTSNKIYVISKNYKLDKICDY
jgi:hypothetical protein